MNLFGATVNLTGFESGDLMETYSSFGTIEISASVKRSGTYSFRAHPTTTPETGWFLIGGIGSDGYPTSSTASVVTSYSRFYFRYATKPSADDEPIFDVLDSVGNVKGEIRLNSSGNLVLYDSVLSLDGTGATTLSANTWYRVELKCGTGVTGTLELKINGSVEVTTAIGVVGTNNASQWAIGKYVDRNFHPVDVYYDDILISDNGYPGAGQVNVLLPNANGNYQTWTIGGSAGTHYQSVNIPSPNGSNYLISTNVNNDKETEALSSGITGTVNSVKSITTIRKDSAGSPIVRVLLRSGSTDDTTSADFSVSSSTQAISKIYDTDPATGVTWVAADIDSIESGIQEKSTTAKTDVIFIGTMVDYVPSPTTGNKAKFLQLF